MGFGKGKKNKSDLKSKTAVLLEKSPETLTKEEKKLISARIAEIKKYANDSAVVQNAIPYLVMFRDGICQVTENFWSATVQFYDANYSLAEFEEQNNIFSKYNEIPVKREMHTSGIAIFVPFTTKELFQTGTATYYGVNTLSGNMIRANRSRLKNPNGLILGTPGAGKSFSVKREILDSFLTTADDIIICDPEGEYFPLVQALHGQLIRIASNSEQHVRNCIKIK